MLASTLALAHLVLSFVQLVALFSSTVFAQDSSYMPATTFNDSIKVLHRALQTRLPTSLFASLREYAFIWQIMVICAACSVPWIFRRKSKGTVHASDGSEKDYGQKSSTHQAADDPGLLRKHSTVRSYSTSIATYPGIRTFYHPHPQADKLPITPSPLPLLVFIHGLGGSLAQFSSLLTGLVNIAPCLGIDLPGCGLSDFHPRDWHAYSHGALAELLSAAIQQACTESSVKEVVLVGHSMGCSLAVTVASQIFGNPRAAFHVKGLVAICPKASTPSINQVKAFKKLLSIPSPVFDLWRRWDRRGGIESPSVSRFVGQSAHKDTKKLQLRYNEQSRTEIWRRMAWGALPNLKGDGILEGGLPGPLIWGQLSGPVFLVAGGADRVTPPSEIKVIAEAMGKTIPNTASVDKQSENLATASSELQSSTFETALLTNETRTDALETSTPLPRRWLVLKTSILPSPASHGLLYDFDNYRTLSGLIQDFMADHIDQRLSLGWQLQRLKESNKWDVKNLAKWQVVTPVSEPIADAFYALKTLREVDDIHAPQVFVERWKDRIKAVIDISHESPVYSPKGLDDGSIEYHKFPTVSKIPPTVDEVKDFVALVDRLRSNGSESGRLIGVHCHYGFNRTGFFVCCYLIERLGFNVQGALNEFAKQRPPGIRHEHFIDTLFVRYCVGLQRAPTF